MTVSLVKTAFAETAGSVIRFPYWWYTEGLSKTARWIWNALAYRWRASAIGLWMQNLLVPMYGQYDLSGRMVSFFMRLVVLFWRSIAFAIEGAAYAILLVAWCLAPVISLVMLIEPLTRPFIG